MSEQTSHKSAVLIVGGGLSGLALGLGLAQRGVPCTVLDSSDAATLTGDNYDGRTTALAQATKRGMNRIGVWARVAERAQAIEQIEVSEGRNPAPIHYHHREVGPEPLGYIVENRALRRAMLDEAQEQPSLAIRFNAEVTGYRASGPRAALRLRSGETLTAPLVVAADGRWSRLRGMAGIGIQRHDYRQTAMVTNLSHEHAHHGRAIERFYPTGPFAVLPMQGRRSSIVWALRKDLAAPIQALDDDRFAAEVAARFGDLYGDMRVDAKRYAFPLSLVRAERLTAPRLVLVGDAAHGIHPIAGQSYNLTMRDIATLVDALADAVALGLDPGGARVLNDYAEARRVDSLTLIGVTHGINALFANDILPLKLARNAGFAAVEALPTLKRVIMRQAMGEKTGQPRLLQPAAA